MASHAAVEQATSNSRRRIQATVGEWFADYPSASDFLDLFFRCPAFRLNDPAATRNGSFFCDPAADKLMNIADREQATNPQRAPATWAKADRIVTYAAPWVILANLNNVDFLPAQVTNYQYNPFMAVLLDQLQIHPRLPSLGDLTGGSAPPIPGRTRQPQAGRIGSVPRLVRDIPARLPAVAKGGRARSHDGGSRQAPRSQTLARARKQTRLPRP